MPSAIISNPTATHTVQVWLSSGSSKTRDTVAAACLTQAEQQLAARLTSTDRRRSFQTARWLGKQAATSWLESGNETHNQIEILSKDPTGITSRPVVYVDGLPADLNISITHQEQTVAVAVANNRNTLGIDLTHIQPVTTAFADVWMTEDEQHQINESDDPALTSAMNWSAREATFKALGVDNEFRPARWSVTFEDDRAACSYQGQQQPVKLSFYRICQDLLLTVANDGANITFRSL
jgi:4'-phosphopantetheinyl transferase EntD